MGDDVRRRVIIFGLVLVAALVFLWPTVSVYQRRASGLEVSGQEFAKSNWPSQPIALGLDLSGGVYLDYRVVTDEAVKSRLQSELQNLRSELRRAKVPVTKAKVEKVNDSKFTASFTLLSARTLEKAKGVIAEAGTALKLEESTTEGGRPILMYSIDGKSVQDIRNSAVEQARETLNTRVNQFGVAEPIITRAGADRIILQMPGAKDVESVKSVVGKVAKLEFRWLPQEGAGSKDTVTLINRDDKSPQKVEDAVLMDGSAVKTARAGFDQNGRIEVSLQFTNEGGRQFARLTGEGVGRRMAIILDGEIYSAPVIQERISGGACSISGSFTLKEASDLALVLRAGALPAPLEVVKERTVGPSLGQESIKKGVNAIIIGFALVLAFMVVYYKKAGMIASGILVLNIVLIMAALSLLGATLTLPGLAGLALTVGMSVDANVIIFERIREELRNGASRDAAVESGFDAAFSAIIDANVTTLLTALILYYFGTGPVRGFAVTLSIGILTTLYCATFVARLAFDALPLRAKGRQLSI